VQTIKIERVVENLASEPVKTKEDKCRISDQMEN
jgi:hypothetical protein